MNRTARALVLVVALTAGGCNWFKKKPPPPPPPPPPQQAPQPRPPVPKPRPATEPPPVAVPVPTPPPPALGQILTTEQKAQYRREYDQSLQVAQQALARIGGKALSRDQAESANRIRSFVRQAQDAQARDPQAAAQLARRAEILARDLLNSIQ